MKARSRLEGRSTSVSGSRDLPGQDRILQQIEIITSELDVLQAEIYRRMTEPARASTKKSPTEEAAAARAMTRFKAALDRLRHVLWFYIEEFADKAEMNARREPLTRGQDRLADLHRTVMPQSRGVTSSQSDPPGSFFDRLDMVIDTCMKATPPPQSSTRKRGK